MRLLLQRVAEAWVDIEEQPTPKAGPGLVALVGFREGDHEKILKTMADKMLGLRIFDDGTGRMNRSLMEGGGSLVLVPQFTLYADCRKGRRPGFSGALEPGKAAQLFSRFEAMCREEVSNLIMGGFGARMQVHLVNDGPVTIMLDSEDLGLSGL